LVSGTLGVKALFNPEATEDTAILNGDTTNLLYLNNAKYQWAVNLYKVMRQNFWTPELIDLTNDRLSYYQLTDNEVEAYDGFLSFLIFLDSLQTNNLASIGKYITAPEVVLALSEQTSQESLHSFSYQTVLETAVPSDKVDSIYYYWKKDEILLSRITTIAEVYQNFQDAPSNETFVRMLIADLLLEGLYFYNGFAFFYSLASRGLMVGTADMIRRIHTDELTHVVLFSNMIKEIYKENQDLQNLIEESVYELTELAVQSETEWSLHMMGNNILGFNPEAIKQNTKYLANKNVFNKLGLKSPYGDITNPFTHLDRVAAVEDTGTNRGNFFESNANNYQQSTGGDSDW
jgi:ribonucleoside-diphosphate reductase beta chain